MEEISGIAWELYIVTYAVRVALCCAPLIYFSLYFLSRDIYTRMEKVSKLKKVHSDYSVKIVNFTTLICAYNNYRPTGREAPGIFLVP